MNILAIDNQAAVQLLSAIGATSWRTRHLRIRANVLAQARLMGILQILHVSGEVEVADAFNQGSSTNTFGYAQTLDGAYSSPRG